VEAFLRRSTAYTRSRRGFRKMQGTLTVEDGSRCGPA
jgi:hypothetical protein